MIAYIEGNIAEKTPTYVIIDCNGLGYFIKISLHTFAQIKDAARTKLHTYLQIKEDAHTLYGFAETKEKNLFELLISVSGVGANTAIAMLSSVSPGEIADAIRGQKLAILKSIKGIGAKTAERIILELKDKIPADLGSTNDSGIGVSPISPASPSSQLADEALRALMGLGFNRAQMESKIADILKKSGDNLTLSDLIKMAMKN